MTGASEPHEAVTIWQATDGSQWRLSFHVARIGGRAECVGLDIRSHPDAGHRERPLGSRTMRDLDFSTQYRRARSGEAARIDRVAGLVERLGGDESELAGEAALLRQGAGREGKRHAAYTKDELRRVAGVYRRAYADGSSSPTRDVAERFGLSRNQAAKLVRRCRDRGLLPETVQGVPRGLAREEDE